MNNYSYPKHITAAGIIIFRNENNCPLLLGLEALPEFKKKNRGTYDIPKGRIDPGETAFDAAKRECYEESGITPIRIIAGPFIDGPLATWIGETYDEEVSIFENPNTGEKEHAGYKWVNPEVLRTNSLDYLKKTVAWAEKTIWDHLKT